MSSAERASQQPSSLSPFQSKIHPLGTVMPEGLVRRGQRAHQMMNFLQFLNPNEPKDAVFLRANLHTTPRNLTHTLPHIFQLQRPVMLL